MHKDLNVIVALMSKCVCVCVFVWEREKDTKRGRGQMCVPGLVSYYVPLRHSVYPRTSCFIHPWFICFGPQSHTRSSSHSYTCLGQGSEIANVFIHQDGNQLVCCFRKQYAIDSFLEQLIYQGNTTWPWALNQHHPLKCIVLWIPWTL